MSILSRKASQETFADDLSIPELRPITSEDLQHEKPTTFRPPLDAPKIHKRIPQTHPHVHPGVRTMILNPVKMSSIEIAQLIQLPVATDINATNAKFRNKIHGHYYTKTPNSPSTRLSLAVSLPMVAMASADNRYTRVVQYIPCHVSTLSNHYTHSRFVTLLIHPPHLPTILLTL